MTHLKGYSQRSLSYLGRKLQESFQTEAEANLEALSATEVEMMFELGWSGEKVLSFILANIAVAESKF